MDALKSTVQSPDERKLRAVEKNERHELMDEDERLELRETTLRPLDVLPHRTGAERLVNTGVLKGRQDLAQMGAAPFRGGGYDSSDAWRSGDPALVGVAKVLEGKGIAVG